MALIIVESPTKARTFNRILKDQDYFVFATMGHIRDLPGSKMAVDFTNNFKPEYQIIANKEKTVEKMRQLAIENKEVILATDSDREGESISYHVAFLLGYINDNWPDIKFVDDIQLKRIVFHEITPNAIKEALENPSILRVDLVKAQQARRILDRVVGYQISPLLWKKMGKNWLSAGRVQSVALRLIVEREKEIRKFGSEDYFQINGIFIQPQRLNEAVQLKAKLISKNQVLYEQKFKLQLFAGEYQFTKTTIDESNKDAIQNDLNTDTYKVATITEDIINRYPPPPYTTSLLQQDGFQKFNLSSKMTMRIAQDLYERGLITYHRTDSFNLSSQFVFRAKDYIAETYGAEYALEKPRGFRNKSKMAQEAHEAIRPTRIEKSAEVLAQDKKITGNHLKIYKMIFDRAVATQMKEAQVKVIKVNIVGTKGYEFVSELQKVLFDGFLKVLNPEFSAKNQSENPFQQGQLLELESLEAVPNQTKAPPRYNEASMIRILEEKGIGRPSTYAPIISLIQDKNYVEKQSRYFAPTMLGEAISDYLSSTFPNIFSLNFTAKMEEELDQVAEGQFDMLRLLQDFYTPLEAKLKEKNAESDETVINTEQVLDEKCPTCGAHLVIKYGRFGKFMACSTYPTCKYTKPFLHFLPNKFCPLDNGRITVRFSRSKMKFYGCENYPTCNFVAWGLPGLSVTAEEFAIQQAKRAAYVEEKKKNPPVKKVVKRKTTKKRKTAKKPAAVTAVKSVAAAKPSAKTKKPAAKKAVKAVKSATKK